MDGRKRLPVNADFCIGNWDFPSVYVNDINVAAKSPNLESMWIRLKHVDLEKPALFLDPSVLGMHSTRT